MDTSSPTDPTLQVDAATAGPGSDPSTVAPPRAPGPPLPERPFGRYVLRRELGRGGFGVVHEAWDTQLGRSVALKMLLARDDPEDRAAERHLREARSIARLKHPSIVTIHDVGEIDGQPYFTMELLAGRSLEECLRGQDAWTTFPVRRRVEIAWQIAEALGYAHAQGVVHRDVKPSNVMIDLSGRAMLMDFGLAKTVSGPATRELTASNAILGTPHYMSPEQADGAKDQIGPASDVFSLGVLLYRALTDALPFEGEGVRALVAILSKDPIPPSKRSPRVQRDLETIVMRCLEKDPPRRFPDGAALAAELRRWLDGEPILSRPASWVERTLHVAGKHRPLVVLGMVTLVFAVSLWHAWRDQKAKSELADRAAKEKQAAEGREKAQREAIDLLERARPALAKAQLALHDKDASYEAIVTQVDAGQRLIERALLACPDLPLGHLLMGESWEALGRDDRAEACYEEALRRDPRFGPARFRLGRLLLVKAFLATMDMTGRKQERMDPVASAWAKKAEEQIRESFSSDADFDSPVDRDLASAMVAYAGGDRPKAARLCEEALRAHGDETGREELLWVLALARIETLPTATLDQAIAIRPKFPLALCTRAMLRDLAGDSAGAIADNTDAIACCPRLAFAYANRGNLRSKTGDRAGALADFDAALAIDPKLVPALIDRGVLHANVREWDAVIADTTAAIQADPTCQVAWVNRADAWEAKGEPDRAIEDCDRAIVLDPEDEKAHVNRANARVDKGQIEAALEDCNAALRINPSDACAYNCRGSILRNRGDTKGALADYDRALALEPSAEAHFNRGQVWADLGDQARALKDYDEAVRLDPALVELWFQRGTLRALLGDVDAGLADLEEALRRDPRHAGALTNRGCVKAQRGDLEGAWADLDAAIAADPSYVQARRNRGALKTQSGDLRGAVAEFERALALDPDSPDLRVAMGQTLLDLGDVEGARKHLERAAEIAPADWPDRAALEKLLQEARRPK